MRCHLLCTFAKRISIMLKSMVLCCLYFLLFFIFSAYADSMIGPGTWSVMSVAKCAEDNMMKFKFDIDRHKMNRTHDGFSAKLSLPNAIDETFAIRIDICKEVDGGCKPYQVLADESFINFVNKFAEGNVREALTMAKIDPPEFPIAKGEYSFEDFIFDYGELPDESMYGLFGAQAFLIKDQLEVGCIDAKVEFKEFCEDDDD